MIEKVFAHDGATRIASVQLPKTSSVKDSANDPDTIQGEGSVKDHVSIPGEESTPMQGVTNTTTIKKSKENLFRDLPAEYQFYQDIVAASEKGLVRHELVAKHPSIDPVAIQLFLESVIAQPATKEHEKYSVYRSEELAGKIRIYRYFSSEGWKEFNKKLGKQVTEHRSTTAIVPPVLEEPPSINYIGESYNILPSTKVSPCRQKTKKRDNAEGGSVPDSPAKKSRTRSKKTTDTSNEISVPVKKKVTRKREIQQESSTDFSQTSVELQEPKTKRVAHSKEDHVEESNKSLEPSQPLDTNADPDNTQAASASVMPIELPQSLPSDPTRKQPSRTRNNITSYFQRNKPINPEPIHVDQPETNLPEPISVDQSETSVPESISAEQQEIHDSGEHIVQLMISMDTQSSLEEEASLLTEPQPISNEKISQDTGTVEQPNTQIAQSNPAPVQRSQSKKSRPTFAEINSTKLRRCKIMLDMMEEQHIRELNSATWKEFNTIEMSTPSGQKMAQATFTKMAKQLHAEKKLTVYVSTIQKFYGVTEIKTFLLHKSVSPESEEMKQFISEYRDGKPADRGKKRNFKKVVVEGLSPIVKPLKVESPAKRYGWIKSKWVRARKLHESLMRYYSHSDRNDRIIDMTEYTKRIPIEIIICLCSNLPYSEQEFRDFLDDPNNARVPLFQLPENIKSLIFLSKQRIRFIIRGLIHVLEALGVMEPIHIVKPDVFTVAPKYKLSQEGLVRDYAFKDQAVVKTMPLQNLQDVNNFWDALYEVCIYSTRYRTEQDEKELLESVNMDDPLYNIHVRRRWVVDVAVSQKQKELLDSFIDFETKTIPSDCVALRMHLGQETGLRASRIRAYYNGILGAFTKIRNRDEKLKLKEQKRVAMTSDPTINDLMLASYESRKVDAAVEHKEGEQFVRSTFVGSRKLRKLRVPVKPDAGKNYKDCKFKRKEIFICLLNFKNIAGPKRHDFSEVEKDLLIYSYCIMKARSKDSSFFWTPATLILPNRTKMQCRRVFNSITRSNPNLIIKIENLKSKWEKYYREGLERQEIEDKDPWNTYNFDLRSYIEYFIRRILEDEK